MFSSVTPGTMTIGERAAGAAGTGGGTGTRRDGNGPDPARRPVGIVAGSDHSGARWAARVGQGGALLAAPVQKLLSV